LLSTARSTGSPTPSTGTLGIDAPERADPALIARWLRLRASEVDQRADAGRFGWVLAGRFDGSTRSPPRREPAEGTMLNERVFLIGGGLCLAAGLLLLAFLFVDGFGSSSFVVLYPGVLFLLFGGFFVYVGRGARTDRLALLRLGERGAPPPMGPTPPAR
jgi:hypothetical protein